MDLVKELQKQGKKIEDLSEPQLRKLHMYIKEQAWLKRDGGIWAYEPQTYNVSGVDKYQEAFHKSLSKIRWVFGGNRSGKSEASIAEAVWWVTGKHPYRKVPMPNRGWIVSLDFPTSRDVAERMVADMIPKSMVEKWDHSRSVLRLKNGCEIGFKSCEAGVEKFQGAKLNWVTFDEEPPYDIFKECLARTMDLGGCIWCAETPTLGMSWTFDEIWELAGIDPDISVFNFDTYWNVFIPREEIERMERLWSPEERDMRLHGKFIQLSGLVFKEYNKDVHVIEPFDIPKDFKWCRFRSIDHGINNPTACIWVAINREGEWYIYDDYYETDKDIEDNAVAIKSMSGRERYEWSTIDGSTKERMPVRSSQGTLDSVYKMYRKHGIIAKPIYLTRDRKIDAIAMFKQLLKVNEKTNRPKFFIQKHCYASIKEISRARWKTQKKVDDKNLPEVEQPYLNHILTAIYFLLLSKARFIPAEEGVVPDPIGWYGRANS